MRYVLLINLDKAAPPRREAELEAILDGHKRFEDELQSAGKARLVHTERLRPEKEAIRVRLDAGRPQVTDGPFAETKEVLGGLYVIECDTRDEAVEWAKKLLLRGDRTVEVRPIWPR